MGEELRCEWSVHSCSSEAEVHEAANVLKIELYRVWQTAQPADEAWLVLEARPPSAFSQMEIVNAGSALVEVFGLPDMPYEDDHQYIMLLSSQQLMSTKDVINKANRNRSFTYSCSDKLSQLAAQHRWKQIKVFCRQPFGSDEQKTCIGLARLNFKLCKTFKEVAADAAEAHLQQNLKAGLAKMFHKGSSSAEVEVISQVTEPSKHKLEQEVARGRESGNPSTPSGKRRLPVWESPSKHMKKEAKEVDAGHGALSSEDGEEILKKQKSTPKCSRPEQKESVTLAKEKVTTSLSIRQHDKGANAQRRKSSESGKSKGSPNDLSKGPSTNSTKGSEQSSSDGNPRLGPKQHSKGQLSQNKDSFELCTTEGSSCPDPHQASQSTATFQVLDQPESSRKEPSRQVNSQVLRGRGKKEETQSKSSLSESNKIPSQSSSRGHEPSRANAITHSFSKFLDGVVFAISGLVNPERAEVRDKALQMGGQYRPDWSSDCTLLICAFANTPKFNQVKNDNGTIVSKVWIQECYQQKKLVEIEKYLMHAGKPWRQIEVSVIDELDEESGIGCDESTTLGSLQDLQQWVCEDVATSITWLKQQETQPETGELKSVAIQGIQLCLDDTIECLKSKQSIKKIMESWDYVPRAVRELAGREEKAGNAKKKNFWSDMLSEAERLKWIYSKELEKMKRTEESVAEKHGKQKFMVDEEDATDDAATDVMSDDLSSDDTQVLDEEEIRESEEAISKILSGQYGK